METQATHVAAALRRAAVAGPIGVPDAVERYVGAQLVDAASPEALVDVIEATVEDDAYWALVRQPKLAPAAPLSFAQMFELSLRIGAAFGHEPALHVGARDLMFVTAALESLRAIAPNPPALGAEDPLWFVSDRATPPPVARAILHGLYANVALHGIMYATRTNRTREAWWGRCLIEQWASSLHEYARLLASFPFIDAPEEVVPARERFDLEALDRQNAAMHRAFARLVDDAEPRRRE